MTTRHLRIHGDNIIECERSLMLISQALGTHPILDSKSPTYLPMYKLNDLQIDLLSGHGRWGVNLSQELQNQGGILREGADSYITEISGTTESVLFAMEYCSALPAGNNAWQRNGRAFSCAMAGIPYLFFAELGGVELDGNRKVKASRFPNPVVPFSYLMASKQAKLFCMPIYTEHPAITDTLHNKYEKVFGLSDGLRLIKALINREDYSDISNGLGTKALDLVKMLSDSRRLVDTLRNKEWDKLLHSKKKTTWLLNNTSHLVWKKKTATKVKTTPTFNKLVAEVQSYGCISIGAKDLPICIIPQDKRGEFESFLKSTYPKTVFHFKKKKPLAIVWITGFKPAGDDSRPDRGLPPLAKMMLGEDAQIMAIVYGPAPKSTWGELRKSPATLANSNGLWQSILYLCDYVMVDSSTNGKKFFFPTKAKLKPNIHPVSFSYSKPPLAFSEQDTDTTIHQLFGKKESLNIFESLCNPPGGDWSGINYYGSNNIVFRWTSLPRVSKVGGKRPDHVIQIQGKESDVFYSIESKLHGRDLENKIGIKLKTYLTDLFKVVPTAFKMTNSEWRLYQGTLPKMRPFSVLSIGAFAYTNDNDMTKQLKRGQLDAVFAFEFGSITTLHVLCSVNSDSIKDILKQVKLGLDGLIIKVH